MNPTDAAGPGSGCRLRGVVALGWGRLTGKLRRGQPLPKVSRLHDTADFGPQVDDEYLYKVVGCAGRRRRGDRQERAADALNWLLRRPSVSHRVIGARNEEQLRANLGAIGWSLTPEQVAKLDEASAGRWPIPIGTRPSSASAILSSIVPSPVYAASVIAATSALWASPSRVARTACTTAACAPPPGSVRGKPGIGQDLSWLSDAHAATIIRRHRPGSELEVHLVDARLADHVHPQPRRQGLVVFPLARWVKR